MAGFQPCMQAAQSLLLIDDQQRMRELLDLANRNNVTFYPVSPNGLQMFDTPINQTLGANPNSAEGVTMQELNRTRDSVVDRSHARREHRRHRGGRHERSPQRAASA